MLNLVFLIYLAPKVWSGVFPLPLSFNLTEVSLSFTLVVALVTSVVLVWSKSYLSELKSYQLWSLTTLSFVFSMFFLFWGSLVF